MYVSQTKQHGSSEVISLDWRKSQIAEKVKEKLEMLFKVKDDENLLINWKK